VQQRFKASITHDVIAIHDSKEPAWRKLGLRQA
jgi:hypothetical protein